MPDSQNESWQCFFHLNLLYNRSAVPQAATLQTMGFHLLTNFTNGFDCHDCSEKTGVSDTCVLAHRPTALASSAAGWALNVGVFPTDPHPHRCLIAPPQTTYRSTARHPSHCGSTPMQLRTDTFRHPKNEPTQWQGSKNAASRRVSCVYKSSRKFAYLRPNGYRLIQTLFSGNNLLHKLQVFYTFVSY